MPLKVTIRTNNAAFGGDPGSDRGEELARIVEEQVAPKLREGHTMGLLTDYNGNTVGEFKLTGKAPTPAE